LSLKWNSECMLEGESGEQVENVMQVRRGHLQHAGLQELRRDIISCFTDIGCFLLPHPGLVATTTEHFTGQIAGRFSVCLSVCLYVCLSLPGSLRISVCV